MLAAALQVPAAAILFQNASNAQRLMNLFLFCIHSPVVNAVFCNIISNRGRSKQLAAEADRGASLCLRQPGEREHTGHRCTESIDQRA